MSPFKPRIVREGVRREKRPMARIEPRKSDRAESYVASGIVVTRERRRHFYGTKDKEEPTEGFLQPRRLWSCTPSPLPSWLCS